MDCIYEYNNITVRFKCDRIEGDIKNAFDSTCLIINIHEKEYKKMLDIFLSYFKMGGFAGKKIDIVGILNIYSGNFCYTHQNVIIKTIPKESFINQKGKEIKIELLSDFVSITDIVCFRRDKLLKIMKNVEKKYP